MKKRVVIVGMLVVGLLVSGWGLWRAYGRSLEQKVAEVLRQHDAQGVGAVVIEGDGFSVSFRSEIEEVFRDAWLKVSVSGGIQSEPEELSSAFSPGVAYAPVELEQLRLGDLERLIDEAPCSTSRKQGSTVMTSTGRVAQVATCFEDGASEASIVESRFDGEVVPPFGGMDAASLEQALETFAQAQGTDATAVYILRASLFTPEEERLMLVTNGRHGCSFQSALGSGFMYGGCGEADLSLLDEPTFDITELDGEQLMHNYELALETLGADDQEVERLSIYRDDSMFEEEGLIFHLSLGHSDREESTYIEPLR